MRFTAVIALIVTSTSLKFPVLKTNHTSPFSKEGSHVAASVFLVAKLFKKVLELVLQDKGGFTFNRMALAQLSLLGATGHIVVS